MNLWENVDLSSTIRSYEYTKHMKYQIYHTVQSEDFKKMDSKTIFEFISNKMEIVPFNDYLRRFLYQRSMITEEFLKIQDSDYIDIMTDSFVENATPYTFSDSGLKMRGTMNQWLKSESVSRTTIFILGFGLGMTDCEVDEFLTKVNKEESFDFGSPEETIYWYCFHNNMRYSKAKELLAYFKDIEIADYENRSLWEAMKHDPKMYVHNEKELKVYLKCLKFFLESESPIFDQFDRLYKRVSALAASTCDDSSNQDHRECLEKQITPDDLEKLFYVRLSDTSGNNLMDTSASILAKQFQYKRMSSRHISDVINRKKKPDRFDIITMLFFLYVNRKEDDIVIDDNLDENTGRLRDFMIEVNDILAKCNMAGLYLVNPYEAFILMCLLSERPLDAYYDVWNLSYNGIKEKILPV